MGTVIVGSSTNQNAGRSRRYRFIFVDECFFIENFLTVWRSLQSVARVKVFVSSVKQGRVAEQFKDMCKERGNYITLSWQDHPWKDQAWFDDKMKLAEFDPEVTKEIEVDYSVNIRDQYYPEVRQALIETVNYNDALPVYVGLDLGKQDLTVIVWAQFAGNYLDIIECYSSFQKPLDWYVPFLNPETMPPDPSRYNEPQLLTLARVRRFRKPRAYFGEQAHFTKAMGMNMSAAQILMKNGIKLLCNPYAVKYEPRRHATSMLLQRLDLTQIQRE